MLARWLSWDPGTWHTSCPGCLRRVAPECTGTDHPAQQNAFYQHTVLSICPSQRVSNRQRPRCPRPACLRVKRGSSEAWEDACSAV